MKLLQRWKQTAVHNKALVLTGAIVALGTIAQVGALVAQICITRANNVATGTQIGKLIEAANIQAHAAQRNVESAAKSAQAASDLAAYTKQSAEVARDALSLQDRPWIGLERVDVGKVEANDWVESRTWVSNYGHGPALQGTLLVSERILCGEFPKRPPYGNASGGTVTIMPNQLVATRKISLDSPLTTEQIRQISSQACGLYIYGRVKYLDTNTRPHWRHWCEMFKVGATESGFVSCTSYNDGDEQYQDGREP
jgi:hypothetical protein